MPDDARRHILQRVAQGELSPEEAAEQLAALDTMGDSAGADRKIITKRRLFSRGTTAGGSAPGDASAPLDKLDDLDALDDLDPQDDLDPHDGPVEIRIQREARGTASTPPTPTGGADSDERVSRVRIRSACRAVTVIADDDVHTAVADGEHSARVDGDTLTIEAVLDPSNGFAFVRGASIPGMRARARVHLRDHTRPLIVRMNPALALDSQVDAGSVHNEGVHGPIRATVSAGAVHIDDFEGPIQLKVAAGSATARGRMHEGASNIECDAGKVTLHLSPDSSVRIHSEINMGQLTSPKQVGAGEATLNIQANLGAIHVSVEEDA
jgi:hypothetical protein